MKYITIKEIEKNLMLYPIREVKIEDMKLQLRELEMGATIKAQGYEETVQTSKQCSNNDKLIYEKERITKLLDFYIIANARVDNWIKCIKRQVAKDVVINTCIKKMAKSRVAASIDRSTRQVDNLYKEGINEIYEMLNV